jgi:hypothetical protein
MLAAKSLLIVASAFWSAESHGPFCANINFPMLVIAGKGTYSIRDENASF